MDERLQHIVDLAWTTAPAREANGAIDRARRGAFRAGKAPQPRTFEGNEEGRMEASLARSYEIVLGPEATFDSFVRDALPKLVYHLESVGAHLPRAAGVVLCLFEGEYLHFLQAGLALAAICEMLGVEADELVRRYGTGERRTAAPPLPLPPGRGPG